MDAYQLSHLADETLVRDLKSLVARDRANTAALLAHLAEVDERRLYLPAAYPSMYLYCVEELGFSEEAAHKRIRAARAARRFPLIFEAVADGKLNLSAVVMLASYLTESNGQDLLRAAFGLRRAELEELIARRFPSTELMPIAIALRSARNGEVSPGTPEPGTAGDTVTTPLSPSSAPGRIDFTTPRQKVSAIAPERYALQLSVGQKTIEKLRYAQSLLSHGVPEGAIDQVVDRALDALIEKLERRKFAATSRPRQARRRASDDPRHIPAAVKRAVWERDHGRCTFVSERGERCPTHSRLEFDHADPVARGGRSTVENLRLRCRAHNQFAAERMFGAGFMKEKRERSQAAARGGDARPTGANPAVEEVIPWLRQLGWRADEARIAAASCEAIPDAPLEERVRVALACAGRNRFPRAFAARA